MRRENDIVRLEMDRMLLLRDRWKQCIQLCAVLLGDFAGR